MIILDLSPIRHTLVNKKHSIAFYYDLNKHTYKKRIKPILPLIMLLHPIALLPLAKMNHNFASFDNYNKGNMNPPLILTLAEAFKYSKSINMYIHNLKYLKS